MRNAAKHDQTLHQFETIRSCFQVDSINKYRCKTTNNVEIFPKRNPRKLDSQSDSELYVYCFFNQPYIRKNVDS